ncbi:MAG: glycosyltransferase [Victivallales bacterium]|nr:glycosyltransferase [Victivallales bacterium]
MGKNIPVSYIISFYNNINALELILSALKRQTYKNFEVIIADDGSRKEIVDRIKKLHSHYSFPIKHVWHNDLGWRKTKILNKAVTVSGGNYLIFTDGDCIPHKCFIKNHWEQRENDKVLTGRRAFLTKFISKKLTQKNVEKGILEKSFLIISLVMGLFRKGKHISKGIYIKNHYFRKLLSKKNKEILGSNFSIHKESLLKINGFDERYLAPGTGEDTDIFVRIKNAGLQVKYLNHSAILYHIYHKIPKSYETSANRKILEEHKTNNTTYTIYGINKETVTTENSLYSE